MKKSNQISNRTIADHLKRKLSLRTDSDLAAALGFSYKQLTNWLGRPTTALTLANLISHTAKYVPPTKNRLVADAIKRKLKITTDRELGERLGWSAPRVASWVKQPSSAKTQANLFVQAEKRAQSRAICPVVEFHDIKAVDSKRGAFQEVFDTGAGASKYAVGLRKRLKQSKGVYIFYDSRGRALYVGKAARQSLWDEIKSAFNRSREEVQTVWRVKHPTRNSAFTSEIKRKVERVPVKLHELARYMSVYQIEPALITSLEALLMRSFANDLLNARMESFTK